MSPPRRLTSEEKLDLVLHLLTAMATSHPDPRVAFIGKTVVGKMLDDQEARQAKQAALEEVGRG